MLPYLYLTRYVTCDIEWQDLPIPNPHILQLAHQLIDCAMWLPLNGFSPTVPNHPSRSRLNRVWIPISLDMICHPKLFMATPKPMLLGFLTQGRLRPLEKASTPQ